MKLRRKLISAIVRVKAPKVTRISVTVMMKKKVHEARLVQQQRQRKYLLMTLNMLQLFIGINGKTDILPIMISNMVDQTVLKKCGQMLKLIEKESMPWIQNGNMLKVLLAK